MIILWKSLEDIAEEKKIEKFNYEIVKERLITIILLLKVNFHAVQLAEMRVCLNIEGLGLRQFINYQQ